MAQGVSLVMEGLENLEREGILWVEATEVVCLLMEVCVDGIERVNPAC